MFDILFPNWSNSAALMVLVGMRSLFNVSLTVMVSETIGLRTLHTAVMGVLTLLSAVLTIASTEWAWTLCVLY